jgi:iron(II)-dependent oxidoreductase
MGSLEGEADEQPAHQICFDAAFWIDRYEVTNAQYGSAGEWTGENRPRERVTWHEALAHCEARGVRLPTEPEWEYAARGPDSWMYPWGNAFVAENVVYDANSGNQTADVGSRADGASWVGASDMSGNVWEWTSTVYRFYPYDAEDGRESPSETLPRVVRGGSWVGDEDYVRAANRGAFDANSRDANVGFRCARDD